MSKQVRQEVVTDVPAGAVPFKNTTVGKTIRTFFQAAAGVLTILLVSPDFRNFLLNNYPQIALYLPLAAALWTAIQNGADPNTKNY